MRQSPRGELFYLFSAVEFFFFPLWKSIGYNHNTDGKRCSATLQGAEVPYPGKREDNCLPMALATQNKLFQQTQTRVQVRTHNKTRASRMSRLWVGGWVRVS